MTCIAALIDGGITLFGADSAGGFDPEMKLVGPYGTKVHSYFSGADEFLIGGSGQARVWQVVKHTLVIPPIGTNVDLMRYMAVDFVYALKECLQSSNCIKDEQGIHFMDLELLIGVRGQLFSMDNGFYAGHILTPFWSIGSGAQEARAALSATQGLSLDPYWRLERALKISEQYNAYVRPPFSFLCSPRL